VPRLDPADRTRRDAIILRLFLSGWTIRDIGRHPKVQLSNRGVEIALQRQLDADTPHHRVLSDEARQVYVARIELLLSRLMPRALDQGDPHQIRAWESVRRLLEQEARLTGLARPERTGRRSGAPEEQGSPGGRGGDTPLAEYRAQFHERHDPRPGPKHAGRPVSAGEPPALDREVAEAFEDAAAQIGWSSTELAMELWRDDRAVIDPLVGGDTWSRAHWEAVQSYRRSCARRRKELRRS
jgi:hypothetical protein